MTTRMKLNQPKGDFDRVIMPHTNIELCTQEALESTYSYALETVVTEFQNGYPVDYLADRPKMFKTEKEFNDYYSSMVLPADIPTKHYSVIKVHTPTDTTNSKIGTIGLVQKDDPFYEMLICACDIENGDIINKVIAQKEYPTLWRAYQNLQREVLHYYNANKRKLITQWYIQIVDYTRDPKGEIVMEWHSHQHGTDFKVQDITLDPNYKPEDLGMTTEVYYLRDHTIYGELNQKEDILEVSSKYEVPSATKPTEEHTCKCKKELSLVEIIDLLNTEKAKLEERGYSLIPSADLYNFKKLAEVVD